MTTRPEDIATARKEPDACPLRVPAIEALASTPDRISVKADGTLVATAPDSSVREQKTSAPAEFRAGDWVVNNQPLEGFSPLPADCLAEGEVLRISAVGADPLGEYRFHGKNDSWHGLVLRPATPAEVAEAEKPRRCGAVRKYERPLRDEVCQLEPGHFGQHVGEPDERGLHVAWIGETATYVPAPSPAEVAAAERPAPDQEQPDGWLGAWCAECGPDVSVDEDGCCTTCGSTAVGKGADAAIRALRDEPAPSPAEVAELREAVASMQAAQIEDHNRTLDHEARLNAIADGISRYPVRLNERLLALETQLRELTGVLGQSNPYVARLDPLATGTTFAHAKQRAEAAEAERDKLAAEMEQYKLVAGPWNPDNGLPAVASGSLRRAEEAEAQLGSAARAHDALTDKYAALVDAVKRAHSGSCRIDSTTRGVYQSVSPEAWDRVVSALDALEQPPSADAAGSEPSGHPKCTVCGQSPCSDFCSAQKLPPVGFASKPEPDELTADALIGALRSHMTLDARKLPGWLLDAKQSADLVERYAAQQAHAHAADLQATIADLRAKASSAAADAVGKALERGHDEAGWKEALGLRAEIVSLKSDTNERAASELEAAADQIDTAGRNKRVRDWRSALLRQARRLRNRAVEIREEPKP